jgi:hypothetical protein
MEYWFSPTLARERGAFRFVTDSGETVSVSCAAPAEYGATRSELERLAPDMEPVPGCRIYAGRVGKSQYADAPAAAAKPAVVPGHRVAAPRITRQVPQPATKPRQATAIQPDDLPEETKPRVQPRIQRKTTAYVEDAEKLKSRREIQDAPVEEWPGSIVRVVPKPSIGATPPTSAPVPRVARRSVPPPADSKAGSRAAARGAQVSAPMITKDTIPPPKKPAAPAHVSQDLEAQMPTRRRAAPPEAAPAEAAPAATGVQPRSRPGASSAPSGEPVTVGPARRRAARAEPKDVPKCDAPVAAPADAPVIGVAQATGAGLAPEKLAELRARRDTTLPFDEDSDDNAMDRLFFNAKLGDVETGQDDAIDPWAATIQADSDLQTTAPAEIKSGGARGPPGPPVPATPAEAGRFKVEPTIPRPGAETRTTSQREVAPNTAAPPDDEDLDDLLASLN